MHSPNWNRASDIDQWAKSIATRSILPELIRLLVLATLERTNLLHINFPARDEAQRRGFDGVTNLLAATTFVPEGFAVWELSCDADPESKANRDYNARIKDPKGIDLRQTTFVVVTARDWHDAPKWQRERNAEGKFKDVKAYDSNSLEHWLSDAPAVGLWLARERGMLVSHIIDIENHWKNVQRALKSALPPGVLLVNRIGTTDALSAWVKSNPGVLSIRAPSPTELVDFFCAWVHSLEKAESDLVCSRAIIVDNIETWRDLALSKQRLILIAGATVVLPPEALAEAARHGHHVLRFEAFTEIKGASSIDLERMRSDDLKEALINGGLEPRIAAQLAEGAGGTFSVLKRLYAGDLSYTRPNWATPTEAIELAPILLAAAWNENNEHDRGILERLTGKSYQDIQKLATRWRQVPDAPLRRLLGVWEFISPQDAWVLLHTAITDFNAKAFSIAAFEVLSEANPALNLPADERYLAQVKGHDKKYSEPLRRGLSEILALSATKAGESVVSDEHDFSDLGRVIVRRLLSENCDWKRWASLGHLLSLLAEAAPEEFLNAVEIDLQSANPQTVELMRQEHDRGVSGAIYHAGLLWALETLAYNKIYLLRVSYILAKLSELDPGGKYRNRPNGSLQCLFFSRRPQTMASVDERLSILRKLIEYHPKSGLKLLLQLLPNNHEIMIDSPKPFWRNWAVGWTGKVAIRDYWRYISGILDLLLILATTHKDIIAPLLGECMALPPDYLAKIILFLELQNPESFISDDRFSLWNKLRELIETHTSFQGSKWARSQAELQQLSMLKEKFAPLDIIDINIHLFDNSALRLRQNISRADLEARLSTDRIAAVEEVWQSGGLPLVKTLAIKSKESWAVGFALAKIHATETQDLIIPSLLTADPKLIKFALGFIGALCDLNGRKWVESLPNSNWTPEQIQRLTEIMPFDDQTWKWIGSFGMEIENLYWANASVWGPTLTTPQYEFALRKLINVRRIGVAADYLAAVLYHNSDFSSELLFAVLDAVAGAAKEEIAGLDAHDIGKIFEALQKLKDVDENRLATSEFCFLTILGKYTRRAVTLERMLGSDPQFFVDCLKLIYRPRHRDRNIPSEEVIPDEKEKEKGRACWHLLHEWRRIPGTQDDGSISQTELINWLSRARRLAQDEDRLEVADSQIGQLFAYAPADEMGISPCVAIREAIEFCASTDLCHGFQIGVRNSRGVVGKGIHEGGKQERELSQKFKKFAMACESLWPRTAAALREISDDYLRDAKHEDDRAEMRE